VIRRASTQSAPVARSRSNRESSLQRHPLTPGLPITAGVSLAVSVGWPPEFPHPTSGAVAKAKIAIRNAGRISRRKTYSFAGSSAWLRSLRMRPTPITDQT